MEARAGMEMLELYGRQSGPLFLRMLIVLLETDMTLRKVQQRLQNAPQRITSLTHCRRQLDPAAKSNHL